MTQSLLAFDTDQIKGYVFGTRRLKEIRGASALLDQLNREAMVEAVTAVDPDAECVYANGGAGLFVVDTEHAQEARQAVQTRYREQTLTASVTGAVVELPDDRKDEQRELNLVRYRLRLNKDGSQGVSIPLTHALLHFCDSCGAGHATEYGEEDERLCASCARKRTENAAVQADIHAWASGQAPANRNRLWGRFLDDLRTRGYPVGQGNRPETFEALGALSKPANYLAMIYVDGDNMGHVVDQIGSTGEMGRFSQAVDQAIYESAVEAVDTHLRPQGDKDTWPFDILLLGGDDLVMVTRAQDAIQTALTLVKTFPELTAKTWGTPLYVSASVVFTHVNYPIGSLRELTESGLTFAKRQAAKRRIDGETLDSGLINFLVVSSSHQQDFASYYDKHLVQDLGDGEALIRTHRPYTARELQALLDQIADLKKTRIPHTKLQQMREAAFLSREQGQVEAMKAILRLRSQDHRQALLHLLGQDEKRQVHMPWVQEPGGRWRTPYVDIAELMDFVPERGS
jgi:hypothetical protein